MYKHCDNPRKTSHTGLITVASSQNQGTHPGERGGGDKNVKQQKDFSSGLKISSNDRRNERIIEKGNVGKIQSHTLCDIYLTFEKEKNQLFDYLHILEI